ncbi:liver-expressed antimicrobial peptide 2 precursor [Danio rerio]|uniref:Liver-expressed antimicrobial peptide 2 n=1 Tax=Danio rerio TaxID=7955 RepID=B3DGL6_DANRE|nr:liver-expressed antimicrobial peptide 2 precursor [Danio rerio]AAI62440.1 Similar to liver-expressed antimicrobial peptide 2 [Danio rerio]AAI62807.1 Similar to liver-expressed antimicrobial peptide 2 [Danio rerio]|eukprot:NP_001122249.1 liver-expressed antimicrobial peptide 2 precursor [Danio rerio]
MKDLSHRGALLACCLLFLLIVQQVTCSPVLQPDTPSTSVQKVQRSLKRTARMTPLWRTVGTKPHGAYCQNNYECSTGICRMGHCSYSQPVNS